MDDTIVQIGAPVLREKAAPIAKKDIDSPKVKKLIARMKKALAGEEYGVAIAAPQMGEGVRLFVVAGHVFKNEDEEEQGEKLSKQNGLVEPTQTATRGPFVRKVSHPDDRIYINPEITRRSRKKKEMSEGCLSVRGQYGTVLRHEKVTLKALDENGKAILQHASGLLAHIFQHETDHLDGILFVDKAENTEPWEEFKKRKIADE